MVSYPLIHNDANFLHLDGSAVKFLFWTRIMLRCKSLVEEEH